MLKKQWSCLLLAASLSFATVACSTTQTPEHQGSAEVSLSQQMHAISGGYKAYSKATTKEEAYAGLQQMHLAVAASKHATPESVTPSDKAQVASYQNQLSQLDATINQAIQLVQANKLTEAKALGPKMLSIRDAAHKQFR